MDGSCNDPKNPTKGQSFNPYGRIIKPVYNDDFHEVRHSTTNEPLHSPRHVGNVVFQSSAWTTKPEKLINMAAIMYGQFLAHDVSERQYHQNREQCNAI